MSQTLRRSFAVTFTFVLMVAAVLLVASIDTARAGTYTVLACDDATDQGYTDANNSWAYSISLQPSSLYTTATTSWWTNFESCPSDGGPESTVLDGTISDGLYVTDSGLGVRDAYDSSGASRGGIPTSNYTFTAPAGAVITELNTNQWIGKYNGAWNSYIKAGSSVIEECETTSSGCSRFGQLSESFSADDAVSSLTFGFRCDTTSTVGCQNTKLSYMSTIGYFVWAVMYGSSVELYEDEAPVLSELEGSFVDASGELLSSSASVSFEGSDGVSGVASGEIVVDSGTAAQLTADSEDFTCDYTYTQPCSRDTAGSASGTLTLDPSTLSDGTHTVETCVTDAADNQTCSEPETVQIDNTAPAAPTGLEASIGTNGLTTVSWDAPDTGSDEGTELTDAYYLVCAASAVSCLPAVSEPTGSISLTESSTTSVTGLTAAAGDLIYIWFKDGAGHESSYVAVAVTAAPEAAVTVNPPVDTTPATIKTVTPDPVKTTTSEQTSVETVTMIDPLVKVSKVKAQKRKVTINGTCSSSADGLQIYLAFKTKGNRTAKKTVTCNGGVWKAKLKLRLKKSYKKATLTVTTDQTATTQATTLVKTVKAKR